MSRNTTNQKNKLNFLATTMTEVEKEHFTHT